MKTKRIRIDNVSELNVSNISTIEPPDTILYLDTSSITRNNIEELQFLEVDKNKYPSRAKRIVKNNTIIYSTVRPEQEHHGIINDPPENLIVSTGFTTIDITDNSVDPLYFYYFLTRKEITRHLQRIAELGVTSYPSISTDDLANLEIEIHSKRKDQEIIANVINKIDQIIILNRRINKEIKYLCRQIYKRWFHQFEFLGDDGKAYKSNKGKMIYNDQLSREIPLGWSVKTLNDIIESTKTGDWGKEKETGNYQLRVKCIRGTDLPSLNGDEINNSPVRYILNNKAYKILQPNDLIIEISGGSKSQSTARISHLSNRTLNRFENPLVCSNFCKAITLKDCNYIYYFKFLWESLYDENVFFDWESKTSGIKNFLFDDFVNEFYIAVPPKEVALKFYKKIKPLDDLIQQNLVGNSQLYVLRDWLLPMLMNGQVTVKETEEELDIAAEPDIEYKATKKPTNVDFYRRTVLAAEIVWQLHEQPTLGHVKLQKIIYLAQQTSSMNLPTNFVKQAAGPYDPQMARSLDKQFKQKKWFEFQKDEFLKYKPLENAGEHVADFDKYFHEEKENIQFFIDTFKKAKTDKVEIIATLFACWKELIEEGKTITDDVLIEQFYNWSEKKARFKQERLEKAINWMRDEGVYPVS